jgi:hypothetical protein
MEPAALVQSLATYAWEILDQPFALDPDQSLKAGGLSYYESATIVLVIGPNLSGTIGGYRIVGKQDLLASPKVCA